MNQHWPDEDVMVKLFAMYKQSPDAGFIQYLYGTSGGSKLSAEALAKGTMALMESRVALAVDVVNEAIFMSAAILEYAVKTDNEKMFSSIGFKALVELLKSQGLPVRVIEVRTNGSIRYLD